MGLLVVPSLYSGVWTKYLPVRIYHHPRGNTSNNNCKMETTQESLKESLLVAGLHQEDESDVNVKRFFLPYHSNLPAEVYGDSINADHAGGSVDDTASFMPTDIKAMDWQSTPENYQLQMIDNSRINYVSIKLRCGVIAMCRANVLTCCPSVLRCINKDIMQCFEMFPVSVHSLIRRTRIWINLTYSYGPKQEPRLLRHTTAHHHDAWLHWAHDRPDKMHGIEIYNCRDYQRMRLHWNGAGLICHEFCHLIHQFALKDGLCNARILHAHLAAKHSGQYDRTLRRDWAGQDRDYDHAYAMVNHKEFWSEFSTTYLCDSYEDLDKGDKTMMDQCSPPLMEPIVLERVRQRPLQITLSEAKGSIRGIPKRQINSISSDTTMHNKEEKPAALRFLHFLIQFCRPKIALRRWPVQPCNKFYPFTRGQLREHDLDTFVVVRDLWREIECWEDPKDDGSPCGKRFGWFVPFVAQTRFRSDP